MTLDEGRRKKAQKVQEGLTAEDTKAAKKRGWRGSARINVDSFGDVAGIAAPLETEGIPLPKY